MNSIFKVVFNAATRTFTAASEAAKSKHVASTVLAGVVVVGAAHAVASTSDGSGANWNNAHDIFVSTTDTESSNLHAVADKVITIDDSLKDMVGRQDKQDARENELSDRTYKAQKTADLGIKYDGDKVVTTDTDLKDTITGNVMRDRDGNSLKVATIKNGDDQVTFRGDTGTKLKNVADGEVSDTSKDAINGSQLAQSNANIKANADQIEQEKDAREKADATKVDNETFVSDQKRQDDAIKGKANSDDLGVTNGRVTSNTTAIYTETLDREAAIKDAVNTQSGVNAKLSDEDARLDSTKADKTALDAEVVTRQAENAVTGEKLGDLNNRTTTTENKVTGLSETVTRNSEAQSVVNADVEARKADRSELTSAVNKQEQFNSSVETTQKNHSDRINAAQGTADKALQQGSINAQDIQTLNKDIQSVDHASKVRNEQTLKDANGYTDHKVNQVRRIATDGIASTAALSGIPQAIHAGRGNVGVGVANYNSSNAVAVGGSYRFSDDQTTIKFGVGTTGSNTVINAGAGYEF